MRKSYKPFTRSILKTFFQTNQNLYSAYQRQIYHIRSISILTNYLQRNLKKKNTREINYRKKIRNNSTCTQNNSSQLQINDKTRH